MPVVTCIRVCRLIALQPLLLNYGRKEQLQLRWGEYGRELGTQTERPIRPLRVIPDPKKVSGIVLFYRNTGFQSDELDKVFLFSVRYGHLIFDQAHPERYTCVLISYGLWFFRHLSLARDSGTTLCSLSSCAGPCRAWSLGGRKCFYQDCYIHYIQTLFFNNDSPVFHRRTETQTADEKTLRG